MKGTLIFILFRGKQHKRDGGYKRATFIVTPVTSASGLTSSDSIEWDWLWAIRRNKQITDFMGIVDIQVSPHLSVVDASGPWPYVKEQIIKHPEFRSEPTKG